jgi:hypothetical protein
LPKAATWEWNRGVYLALGLSHCGACHTPRNLLGAEKPGNAYGGAVIDNWVAPPLTAANPAPAPWTHEELYLRCKGTSALRRFHAAVARKLSIPNFGKGHGASAPLCARAARSDQSSLMKNLLGFASIHSR